MLSARASGEGINRQQNFASWRQQTKEWCRSRGGMRRAKLAAAADVVMLLLSCRGSSHKRRKANRLCAFAGLLLSEAAVAPGTHPPVGRKRGGVEGQTGAEHGAP